MLTAHGRLDQNRVQHYITSSPLPRFTESSVKKTERVVTRQGWSFPLSMYTNGSNQSSNRILGEENPSALSHNKSGLFPLGRLEIRVHCHVIKSRVIFSRSLGTRKAEVESSVKKTECTLA